MLQVKEYVELNEREQIAEEVADEQSKAVFENGMIEWLHFKENIGGGLDLPSLFDGGVNA